MAYGLSQIQTKMENNMVQLTSRVGKLEKDFSTFSGFIRDSLDSMGEKIDKGNTDMGIKIDELFENIGKNNDDLDKIRTGQKMRAAAVRWFVGTLKQCLSIILSIVTLYFIFKYGGKVL